MWFDASVVESVVALIPPWIAVLILFVSYLGSVYVIGPLTVLVYLRGKSWQQTCWPSIVIGAYALFVFLKPLTGILRPAEHGVESPLADVALPLVIDQLHVLAVGFDTGSFPSGHTIAATVFFGLFVVDMDIGSWRTRIGSAVVILAVLYVSRIALGVHYVGDVVGGAIIGFAYLLGMLWLRDRVSNPVETILGLAVAPSVGAIFLGRPSHGAFLLVIIAVTYVTHRRFFLHSRKLRQYSDMD